MERHWLEQMLDASDLAKEAYSLFQEFRTLLANRHVEGFLAWFEQVGCSSLESIRAFAMGLRRDLNTVLHTFTLSWSSGAMHWLKARSTNLR